jgi:hypothetical protein
MEATSARTPFKGNSEPSVCLVAAISDIASACNPSVTSNTSLMSCSAGPSKVGRPFLHPSCEIGSIYAYACAHSSSELSLSSPCITYVRVTCIHHCVPKQFWNFHKPLHFPYSRHVTLNWDIFETAVWVSGIPCRLHTVNTNLRTIPQYEGVSK